MGRALAAELDKLRTLPAMLATVVATLVLGPALAVALARWQGGEGESPVVVALGTLVYLQAAAVALGYLAVQQEYAGDQVSTTLRAVPQRGVLSAATLAATALMTLLLGVVTMVLATIAAGVAATAPGDITGADVGHAAGAVTTFVALAVLSQGVTLALRGGVGALVAMLALVFVISPILVAVSDAARWLPDRAGAALYGSSGEVLEAHVAALVLAAWLLAGALAGSVRLVRSDA